MIGHIRGKVLAWHPPELLLDVAGIAFELRVAAADWTGPNIGSEQSLFTHTLINNDSWRLYGFSTEAHRRMFRSLIQINKIGPSTALDMLSHISLKTLYVCLKEGDIATLTALPGIGKRTAERLIMEMRDRITSTDYNFTDEVSARENQATRDACQALETLGYSAREAQQVVAAVSADIDDSGAIVRAVLENAGKNS